MGTAGKQEVFPPSVEKERKVWSVMQGVASAIHLERQSLVGISLWSLLEGIVNLRY